jgi:hypothetical protein
MLIIALAAMTSCSNDDNPAPNPMAKKIVGTWLAEYEAEGTLTIEAEAMSYSRVIDVYEFDGVTKVNIWNRYFFRGESPDPFADLGGGSGAKGKFDFTSTADGIISVTLTETYLLNPEDLPLYAPLHRTLHYTDNAITASGIGGTPITLLRADNDEEQQLSDWNVRLHGGFNNKRDAIDADVIDNNAQEPARTRRR